MRFNKSLPTLSALFVLCAAGVVEHAAAQEAAMPFLGGGGRNAPYPAPDGKVIYEHICQSCHMADGRGGHLSPAVYPALVGNPRLAARVYPAMLVVNGQGAMPAFGTMLSDEQVAAVVNYLRTNFGNTFADTLTVPEVRALRPSVQTAPTELRGR